MGRDGRDLQTGPGSPFLANPDFHGRAHHLRHAGLELLDVRVTLLVAFDRIVMLLHVGFSAILGFIVALDVLPLGGFWPCL